jgi:hypothetical protein
VTPTVRCEAVVSPPPPPDRPHPPPPPPGSPRPPPPPFPPRPPPYPPLSDHEARLAGGHSGHSGKAHSTPDSSAGGGCGGLSVLLDREWNDGFALTVSLNPWRANVPLHVILSAAGASLTTLFHGESVASHAGALTFKTSERPGTSSAGSALQSTRCNPLFPRFEQASSFLPEADVYLFDADAYPSAQTSAHSSTFEGRGTARPPAAPLIASPPRSPPRLCQANELKQVRRRRSASRSHQQFGGPTPR